MNKLTNLSRSVKESVVLITGAGSGMGKATAQLFADQGAITIATDINKKNIDAVSNEINNSGGISESFSLDVGNKENIAETVKEIINKFGKLDILINNAGIAIPTDIDNDDYEIYWDKTHDIWSQISPFLMPTICFLIKGFQSWFLKLNKLDFLEDNLKKFGK